MTTTTDVVQGPLPPPEPVASFQEWLGVDVVTADKSTLSETDLQAREAVFDTADEVAAELGGIPADVLQRPGALMACFLTQHALLLSEGNGVDEALLSDEFKAAMKETEREDFDPMAMMRQASSPDDPVLSAAYSVRYVLGQPDDRRIQAFQAELLAGVRFRYYEARVNDDKLFYQHVVWHVRRLFVACHMSAKSMVHPEVIAAVTALAQCMYNMDELCRVDDERPPCREMSRAELDRVVAKLDEARHRFNRYLAQGLLKLRAFPVLCIMVVEFARVAARFNNFQPPKRDPKNAYKLVRDFDKKHRHDPFDETLEEMLEYLNERTETLEGAATPPKRRELVITEDTPTAQTAGDPNLRLALHTLDQLRDRCVAIGDEYADGVCQYLAAGYVKRLTLWAEEEEDDDGPVAYTVALRWNCNMTPEASTSWSITRDSDGAEVYVESWQEMAQLLRPLVVKRYEVGLRTSPPPLVIVNHQATHGEQAAE